MQGEEELRRALQPRLALEVLLLRLVHLEPLIPLENWLKRLTDLEQSLARGAAPAEPKKEAIPAAARTEDLPTVREPAVPEDLAGVWSAFLDFIRKEENGPLYAKLSHCRLEKISDHCLYIKAGRAWSLGGARQEARLKKLVQAFFGPQYTLSLELVEKGPNKLPNAGGPKPLTLADLKQQALEIFGGRWLDAGGEEEKP